MSTTQKHPGAQGFPYHRGFRLALGGHRGSLSPRCASPGDWSLVSDFFRGRDADGTILVRSGLLPLLDEINERAQWRGHETPARVLP